MDKREVKGKIGMRGLLCHNSSNNAHIRFYEGGKSMFTSYSTPIACCVGGVLYTCKPRGYSASTSRQYTHYLRFLQSGRAGGYGTTEELSRPADVSQKYHGSDLYA